MPVAFVGLIIVILLAIRLWNLLFVKSAYLERHTLERIRAGSAPTLRMERARKTIGNSFLIPLLIWINWEIYLKPTEDCWILFITLSKNISWINDDETRYQRWTRRAAAPCPRRTTATPSMPSTTGPGGR